MTISKLLILGATLIGVSSIPVTSKANPKNQIWATTEIIGPYEKYQEDPTLTYTVTSSYTRSKKVYEEIIYGNESFPNFRTVTNPGHNLLKTSSPIEMSIPTSMLLGDEGMTITIRVLQTTDDMVFYERSFTIYPISRPVVDPTIMRNDSYHINRVTTVKFDFVSSVSDETYLFSNFLDYFLTDIYYRVTFDQFCIERNDEGFPNFTYESAFMRIKGLRECFPKITYVNNEAIIPLEIFLYENRMWLELKETMFVEPKTLIMSDKPIDGYLATDWFYLPIPYLDELQGATIAFEINDIGYNKTSFRWTSRVIANKAMLGDCSSSQYCVTGKVKQ